MRTFVFTVLLAFWCTLSSSIAGLNETLPTYHWAYEYLSQLRVRGYFDDLFVLNQPFTRGEVAEQLLILKSHIESGKRTPKQSDLPLIDRLMQEFSREMQELSSQQNRESIKFGTVLIPGFKKDLQDRTQFRGDYRAQACVSVGNHMTVTTAINFDQDLVHDPTYWGKKKWGYAVYAEQGYAQIRLGRFHIRFGRDFIKWGSGRSGNLLISDYSRPMDFLSASGQFNSFRVSYFIANLDRMRLPDSLAVRYKSDYANRYFAAHRVDLKLLKGKVNFGLSEAVLFGGPQRNLEFAYANPFISYFGVVENDRVGYTDGGKGNLFASTDFALFPIRNTELFGEILIDDLQVEKTGPGDLEPPEWGYLIGFHIADPFHWDGTNMWGEYIRITNRTYNAASAWEKSLNYNRPIGYFMGNDFDRWELNINRWLTKDLQIGLGFERIRRGEGRIEKEFDTPWMNYTVEEGYSEPFPTGIVEKTNAGKIEILYQPSADWRAFLLARYSDIKNANNSLGVNDSGWFLKAGVWLEWEGVRRVE
jgi:hypothetical protein